MTRASWPEKRSSFNNDPPADSRGVIIFAPSGPSPGQPPRVIPLPPERPSFSSIRSSTSTSVAMSMASS